MDESERGYDRTFLSVRKEAWLILLAWAICLVWTTGYAALVGYDLEGTQIKLVFGMPAWVFWGVLAPWLMATAFSIWFSLFYIADDA